MSKAEKVNSIMAILSNEEYDLVNKKIVVGMAKHKADAEVVKLFEVSWDDIEDWFLGK